MSNTTLKFGSNLAISSSEKVRIYRQIFSQIFLYSRDQSQADSTHAYVEFTDVELAYVENGGRGRGGRARRGGSLFDAAHFERSHLALAF
jgi:hypothetical protein